MALANYTDLLASIASHIDRTDQTANIPDWVVMAESAIAEDVRLRNQLVVTSLSTVSGQDYITLPVDWLEFVYVKYSDDPLAFLPADTLRASNEQTGTLLYYSIEGDRLLLNPTPSAVVSVHVAYYGRITALATTATNFLLTKYPQVYLYKALACGYRFLMDDQRAMYWDGLYAQEIEKANMADKRALVSGSPLTARPR